MRLEGKVALITGITGVFCVFQCYLTWFPFLVQKDPSIATQPPPACAYWRHSGNHVSDPIF